MEMNLNHHVDHRPVRRVPARRVLMGSHWLEQPLPAPGLDRLGPFLLLHHWQDVLPGGQTQHEVGVGPHPHRGFSPVTCIYHGSIRHRDSTGQDHIVEAGGTQWMDSGSGVVHSERPDAGLAWEGGYIEFIQFWVNTPRAHKMEAPAYRPLSREATPTWTEGGWTVALVQGTWGAHTSPIPAHHPMRIANMTASAGAQIDIPMHARWLGGAYVLDGTVEIGDARFTGKDLAVIDPTLEPRDGDAPLRLRCTEDARVLLLLGAPFQEPVVSHGPFVMTEPHEIQEAIRDFQLGRMGTLHEG